MLDGITRPVLTMNDSFSFSNLIECNAATLPFWKSNLLVSTLRGESVFRLALDSDNKVWGIERIEIGFRVRDIVQADNGDLYLLSDELNPRIRRYRLKSSVTN